MQSAHPKHGGGRVKRGRVHRVTHYPSPLSPRVPLVMHHVVCWNGTNKSGMHTCPVWATPMHVRCAPASRVITTSGHSTALIHGVALLMSPGYAKPGWSNAAVHSPSALSDHRESVAWLIINGPHSAAYCHKLGPNRVKAECLCLQEAATIFQHTHATADCAWPRPPITKDMKTLVMPA